MLGRRDVKTLRPQNRRATVYQQSSSGSANTDGGFSEEASEYCVRWARAWPIKGREAPAMEHQHALTEWIIQMRHDSTASAITPKMWLVLSSGERLDITSVYDPDGRNRLIEMRGTQTE